MKVSPRRNIHFMELSRYRSLAIKIVVSKNFNYVIVLNIMVNFVTNAIHFYKAPDELL